MILDLCELIQWVDYSPTVSWSNKNDNVALALPPSFKFDWRVKEKKTGRDYVVLVRFCESPHWGTTRDVITSWFRVNIQEQFNLSITSVKCLYDSNNGCFVSVMNWIWPDDSLNTREKIDDLPDYVWLRTQEHVMRMQRWKFLGEKIHVPLSWLY